MRKQDGIETTPASSGRERERGGALVIAVCVVTIMISLAFGLVAMGTRNCQEALAGGKGLKATYIAEAGIPHARADLIAGGTGNLGTPDVPLDFGDGGYFVRTELGEDGTLRILSTGIASDQRRTLEAVLVPTMENLFGHALFGDVDLGSKGTVFIDSYSSAEGSYASQATNLDPVTGEYYANENGSVGSNGDVILRGGSTVFGDVTPGPDHSLMIRGGEVHVTGSTTPLDAPVYLPPVNYQPPVESSGSLQMTSDRTLILTDGTYRYSELSLSAQSTLLICGEVELYVDGDISVTGGARIVVDQDAKVKVYHGSGTATLAGGGLVNDSEIPGNFQLFSAGEKVEVAGDASFYGAVYAPGASVHLTGGADFFGSMVGHEIAVLGTVRYHYDEELGEISEESSLRFRLVSLRRVSHVGQ
jgi:hypothetical protein